MSNSSLFRFLIIIALLFAQIGGVTHGISHILVEHSQREYQSPSGDQSPPHEQHCNLCDAYAQIASTIGSSFVSLTPLLNFGHIEQGHPYTFFSPTLFSFAARGPPYSE